MTEKEENMEEFIPTFKQAKKARTLNVEQVIELEQKIAAAETPLDELMRRAGTAVALYVELSTGMGGNMLILAGSGNNGGDGWVAAELLANAHADVTLLSTRALEDITAEPARSVAEKVCARTDLESLNVIFAPTDEELADALAKADIVIDALLGTGFDGDTLHGATLQWITALNAEQERRAAEKKPLHVIAVDVPSGLNAQTGTTTEPCVHAAATVTMMVLKPGLKTERGVEVCGQMNVATIHPIENYLLGVEDAE